MLAAKVILLRRWCEDNLINKTLTRVCKIFKCFLQAMHAAEDRGRKNAQLSDNNVVRFLAAIAAGRKRRKERKEERKKKSRAALIIVAAITSLNVTAGCCMKQPSPLPKQLA